VESSPGTNDFNTPMAQSNRQRANNIPLTLGVIERPRLIATLNGITQYRVALIAAAPGYGKTTITSQFARQAHYPVAWHTIDERQRDAANLQDQCLSALEDIAPGIKEALSLRSEGLPPGELATLVTRYLDQNLDGDAIYVLDDVQYLTGAPGAETWLSMLVEHMPARCHLVLSGRSVPALPFTEMIARNEVLPLGQAELGLSHEEIQTLAERLGTPLTPDQIDELATRLEGWPAGIMLALQPLPAGMAGSLLKGGAGPEALFASLADSMLKAQPPDLKHFLLTSSTLKQLTPEWCSSILGMSGGARWLAAVQNRNLFVSRVSGKLVYHTLFRDFLQEQLRRTAPDRYVDLHLRAARWFEERDDIDSAFNHYVSAGRLDRAGEIAEWATGAYFVQGKFETLLNWSARLREVGARAPQLSFECAMVLTDRYDYQAAQDELERAMAEFTKRGEELGIAKVRLQRARISLLKGDYQESIKQAAQLLSSHLAEVRGRALRIIGLAYLRLGDVTASVEYLEESLALHRAVGLRSSLSHLLQDLHLAYTRLGRLDDAGACLHEVVALRRNMGGASAMALALNNLGYYLHQRSDYRQALATLEEGLEVIAGFQYRNSECYLLWSLGDLKRDLGLFEEARRLHDRALQLLPVDGEPNLHSAILTSGATLRRWEGQIEEAILVAQEAAEVAAVHDIAFEHSMAEAALWAARAYQGEIKEALDHLDNIVEDLHKQGARFEMIGVLGVCALTSLLNADKESAGSYLQRAQEVAQEIGSAQPLAAEIEHSPLLKEFVNGSLSQDSPNLYEDLDQLRQARVRLASSNGRRESHADQDTYSLRILTLGQEQVERDGIPVTSTEWRSSTSKMLFLYLFFKGPHKREELGLVFWPDNSDAQLRRTFHTTLHRARQALGKNVILFEDEDYLINPNLEVTCDALELQNLTDQARPLPYHDARTEHLWRRATEIYRGDFLPSVDEEWVLAQRQGLRDLYIEALVSLGYCAKARNDLRAAIDAFMRVLDEDPYREDVHREVLKCYVALGQTNQVLSHYQGMRQRLWDELGVVPSDETERLVKKLLH
jgi:LuxR family maltose regulon positive regulatory protein